MKGEKVWVRLKPHQVEFLDWIGTVLGTRSRSDQIKFALDLLRFILPRIDAVIEIVALMLQESGRAHPGEGGGSRREAPPPRIRGTRG